MENDNNKLMIYSDLLAGMLAGISSTAFLGSKMDWMFGRNHLGRSFRLRSLLSSSSFRMPIASALEWCESSCCHELRLRPTRGSQRSSTRARQPNRRMHLRRRAQRSVPCEEDGACGRQGNEDLLWMISSWLSRVLFHLCLVLTFFVFEHTINLNV